MPPLTGVRGGEGVRAPTVREKGKAARATRSGRRRDSRERQRAGWPELATSMTYRRRSGETCQIPIEPAPAGHALVGVRGPIPAPIEYTGQALELVASLTEMVQTSLDLLSLYRIPIPFKMSALSGAPAGAVAGPSVLPPIAERRGRQAQACSRGRAIGIHGESGP
ncbi:uncharacterized protein LOC114303674 [Camellia sinensis]|nr:uncharacterized protein LOC114303674 [Camellia sinensis]XP_028104630.1 uncharacterized protein LOC114303674 [Camellia sinensis]